MKPDQTGAVVAALQHAGPAESLVPGWSRERVGEVIETVRVRTGVDFSRYRGATILRRIRNRMISAGVDCLEEYAALLRGHPAEAGALLERLTIKVSRFYRDVRSFDVLRDEVLPSLARSCDRPLRLWSAGCGRGEEAWTLAMLLEHAGIAGGVAASDIDPSSLERAARGVYRAEVLGDLPANLAQAYLEPCGQASEYRIHAALRARVRFLRHDLTTGVPPEGEPPFDLVCCRNLLIYLKPHAQDEAFQALCAALAPEGYLCLGEAEWPPAGVLGRLRSLGRKSQVWRLSGRSGG